MGNRFGVLTFLTGVFQLVCFIALIGGIALIFNGANPTDQNVALANNPFAGAVTNPFLQVAASMKIAVGAGLALYGLTGLVFSGGITVLISIDGTLASIQTKLKSSNSIQSQQSEEGRSSGAWTGEVVHSDAMTGADHSTSHSGDSSPTGDHSGTCAACNAVNDANGRFCENCGAPLH